MMRLAKDGSFSITIQGDQLTTGLRLNQSNPRNSVYMTELTGLIGKDEVLQTIEDLNLLAIASLNETFPYPQLFVFSNHIYVCGRIRVYEYVGGLLVLRLRISEAKSGDTWRVLGFADFICMSNGIVTLVRDPLTAEWSESTEIPAFHAACDYNGQVLIGNVIPLVTTLAPTTT